MHKIRAIVRWPLRIAVFSAVLVGLWFVASAALTTSTADRRHNIEMEVQHLKRLNTDLAGKNGRLTQRIQALRTDERVIEQIAREELGMIRTDETIFLFPPEFDKQFASSR